jgi:flagellar biosynthesis protein FlhG
MAYPANPAFKPVLIPVASGKGGVGKSFVAANLAMALAQRGHRVIAADLDFGGSNLYHFMGLPNRNAGIGDFLCGHASDLKRLLVPTAVSGLQFLPGDGRTPLTANLHAAQKAKLLRHLRALSADYLILDIGAGSSFTTLDCYGAAELGLMVTTPERPAIMGMLVFLKSYLYRTLENRLAANGCRGLKPLLKELMQLPMAEQPDSIEVLKGRISEASARAAEVTAAALAACRPRIVFNMGTSAEETALAATIAETLRESLGVEPDFFGFVFLDPNVREASRRRLPFLPHYPESAAASGLLKLAERVEKFWSRPVEGSAALMARHVFREAAAAAPEPAAPPRPAFFGLLEGIAARTREILHL